MHSNGAVTRQELVLPDGKTMIYEQLAYLVFAGLLICCIVLTVRVAIRAVPAHAGDQVRGFAQVTDEVRNLTGPLEPHAARFSVKAHR